MLDVIWQPAEDGDLEPWVADPTSGERTKAVWAPQPGSQQAFLECPVFEVLYEGNRGPGKTDALLMDFAQHVGQGWGADWQGIIFRRTYPELRDLEKKAHKWFKRIWPQATYNQQKHVWTWPTGEQLWFSYARKPQDYDNYHGHAYPFVGWEELTTWADDKTYRAFQTLCRSTRPGMPRKYRATANPYGRGHNWVKARWRLPVPAGLMCGAVIRDSRDPESGILEPPRVAIHGMLSENQILLTADPNYVQRIAAGARNPAELKAWLYGDWNIVSGGMFDDLWDPAIHVVHDVPLDAIPSTWTIDRSFDWGQSHPFSVGWWAESNGESFEHNGHLYGAVRGDTYRIAEWYGWNGRPNEGVRMQAREIARGIVEREQDWGIHHRVKKGPADPSIFTDFEPKKSIAGDMAKPPNNVKWTAANNERIQGWEQVREMLRGALPGKYGPREDPGLFVMKRCQKFLDTVPCLSRSDKDPDDADTDAEDHIADETRYRLRVKRSRTVQRSI